MQTVFAEQQGRVLTVRLDNPPRNLLDTTMLDELDELVRRLESDRSVGAVVLTGAPDDIFVSGADSAQILDRARRLTFSPSPRQARALLGVVRGLAAVPGAAPLLARTDLAGTLELLRADRMFLRLSRLDKVVIAAVNGIALGGGCALALACDLRLIAEDAGRLGLIESNVGLLAAGGSTQRLVRLLGSGRAMELLLEGRVLGAAEAAEAGLANAVVPDGDLLDTARDLADRLARRPAEIVREIKRCVYEGGGRPLHAGVRLEEAGMIATATRPAAIRGLEEYHARLDPGAPATSGEILATWARLRERGTVDVA